MGGALSSIVGCSFLEKLVSRILECAHPYPTFWQQPLAGVSQTAHLPASSRLQLTGENGNEDEKWNAAWIILLGDPTGLRRSL
jgi:hypothetical protein